MNITSPKAQKKPSLHSNGSSNQKPNNNISRSDENITNPNYPTTFVQADSSNFKQVVQMLTGSSGTAKQASKNDPPPPAAAARGGAGGCSIPPIKSTGQKKQGFKLYERRNILKNGLMINTASGSYSPRLKPEILSPSILDFPGLVLSPAKPLNEHNSTTPAPEKSIYFCPSPRESPRESEPRLLQLFPLTSPRDQSSSSSSS